MVYLPMTYIYGHRVTCDITDLIKEIRTEIYPDPYESIDWKSYRTKVAKIDEYRGHSSVLEFAFAVANFYEDKVRIPFLRKKSLDFLIDYVRAEDDQTLFVDIGPVNKVINMLCRWHADGPDSDGFKKHVARLEDYLWLAEDGLKMQGYNGSQLWDTSFAVMAINETGLESEFRDCLLKAYHYMDITQVEEDVPNREKYFRHISKGGWPFSTKDHGWPIADCTAHGLEAVLQLHEKVDSTGAPLVPKNLRISDERIFDAVNVLISFENEGGWATYENTRGSAKLEWLNPSEVFGDIMIDYSYTELTSSVVQALCTFREQYPDHRSSEVNGCIERGCQYITTRQRDHGGWYGSWAVCFTYGTWFAIEALVKSGMPKDSPAIMRGCQFLVERQMEDGGWGESYLSSVTHEWHSHEKSQVVNTAWALIALMLADFDGFHRPAIDKGIKLLLSRQDKDGDWEQEAISGVFNGNCMITYTAYRNVFPIRALGMYTRKYGNPANLH
jgi:squalene/oxidosqualene cyclase-like protein